MEPMTGKILSKILYDGFVKGVTISTNFLKEKLQGWLFDDKVIEALSQKLNALHLEDLGEHAIERKINNSPDILNYIQQIRQDQSIGSIVQYHSGSGDNVAGNKIINNGK